MKKRLFIIDAMNLAYRSFHAVGPSMATRDGRYTAAVYGAALYMERLLLSEKPDYILVATDPGGRTFRHDLYEGYKAHRGEMPGELRGQLPLLWRLFAAMGIRVVRKDGLEADDLIGSAAVQLATPDLHCIVASGDKDFMQLVGPGVSLYTPRSGGLYTPRSGGAGGTHGTAGQGGGSSALGEEGVVAKFGCRPGQVVCVLALMGDPSDNVPGVRGVGPVTAARLIREYGSLEGVYENLGLIGQKKLRENLERDHAVALLSKKLVTIKTDCELGLTLGDLALDAAAAANAEGLARLYDELEFRSLAARLRQRTGTGAGTRDEAGQGD